MLSVLIASFALQIIADEFFAKLFNARLPLTIELCGIHSLDLDGPIQINQRSTEFVNEWCDSHRVRPLSKQDTSRMIRVVIRFEPHKILISISIWSS